MKPETGGAPLPFQVGVVALRVDHRQTGLAGLLRARYCDPRIRGINKTDGLTWKVKEILDRARAELAAGLNPKQPVVNHP